MPALPPKPSDTTGCPPQVIALVDYLRSTLTHESKLKQLIKWGIECEAKGYGAEEFLKRARTLTTGTVTKIDAYLASLKTATKAIEEVPATKPVEAVAVPAITPVQAPVEDKPPLEDKPQESKSKKR